MAEDRENKAGVGIADTSATTLHQGLNSESGSAALRLSFCSDDVLEPKVLTRDADAKVFVVIRYSLS